MTHILHDHGQDHSGARRIRGLPHRAPTALDPLEPDDEGQIRVDREHVEETTALAAFESHAAFPGANLLKRIIDPGGDVPAVSPKQR